MDTPRDDESFVYLGNARVDEQKRVMEQIVKDGVCPFCMEHLARYHKKPVLRESEHWILTENQWPYEHTKYHFLAITKEHKENIADLPPVAMAEMLELFQWAIRQYGIAGGGLSVRFGDPEHSGGSVAHLHAQLVVPDIDDPDYEPVRIKIGKSARKKA